MVIQKSEEITAWKKAQDLAVEIFSAFNALKHFAFRDQILRAAVSISNNIAACFDRRSDADFSRFLYVAAGSASEVKPMIYLAERLQFIKSDKKIQHIEQPEEVSGII